MTKTIESLQSRIAELEAKNERLKVENRDSCIGLNDYYGKQLATSQLRETQLRDDLEAIAAGSIKIPAREYAMHALALPTDTSALDAYVAEKVKESHKVIPREGLVPHAYQLEATHNNAEYWYKWGHSEEMAAKGESVICMAQAVFAWRNAAYSKAKEVATLTRQRDLAVEALRYGRLYAPDGSIALDNINAALSAIKESEGK